MTIRFSLVTIVSSGLLNPIPLTGHRAKGFILQICSPVLSITEESTWVTLKKHMSHMRMKLILGVHIKCAYHLNIYILRTYPFFWWPKLVESNKSLFLLAKPIVFPGNKAPIPKSIVCGSSLLSVSWSIFKNHPISQKYTVYAIHINHKKHLWQDWDSIIFYPHFDWWNPYQEKNMLEK